MKHITDYNNWEEFKYYLGNKSKGLVDMKYLKTINEMLIHREDRENFISEITSIFIDEVVDKSIIDELPSQLEEIDGLYYDVSDIFLAADLDRPYLSVLIYSDTIHDFLSIKYEIIKFVYKLESIGFVVEYHKQVSNDDYAYLGETVNDLDDLIDLHGEYVAEWHDADPFDIRIYY
jgi:hypothetical protein